MPRWDPVESEEIFRVRELCREELQESPNYPEVVGDRKILRFLRGHGHNVEKAAAMLRKFLSWRKEFGVNEIRRSIVEGGLDHPLKFPNGEKILRLIPQLIITPHAFDKSGSPICVEQYNFSPAEVLSKISIQEYILFVMHSLEYRSLVVEQLSEKRERVFLASLTDGERAIALSPTGSIYYGVLLNTCVVRDLGAVGFEHVTSQGQEIIRAVVTLSSDNYPELMRKCFMINTPWVFNALWYFIKGLLAARTLSKISIMGTDFQSELEREISTEFIPSLIGGQYNRGIEYESFAWDRAYLCGTAYDFKFDIKDATTQPPGLCHSSDNSSRLDSRGAEAGPRDEDSVRLDHGGSLKTESFRVTPFFCPVIRGGSFGISRQNAAQNPITEDPSPLALTGWL